jgi:hypothetical protein
VEIQRFLSILLNLLVTTAPYPLLPPGDNPNTVNNNNNNYYYYYIFLFFFSLHFKTLKSHIKTLKIRPYMLCLLWNHLQGVYGRTLLGYWIGMLIYICYKECRYVAVCQFIPSVCVCGFLSGRDIVSTSKGVRNV